MPKPDFADYLLKTSGDEYYLRAQYKNVVAADKYHLVLRAPVHVIPNLDGDTLLLFEIFRRLGFPEGSTKFLFLGNYAGDTALSTALMNFMLALKIVCPDNVFLLRGRAEIPDGIRPFAKKYWERQVREWQDIFKWMPASASIFDQGAIFCTNHGLGLPYTTKMIETRLKMTLPQRFDMEQRKVQPICRDTMDVAMKNFMKRERVDLVCEAANHLREACMLASDMERLYLGHNEDPLLKTSEAVILCVEENCRQLMCFECAGPKT
ncbi:unnamed protein product, partial [Mesorhabditis spiculigera]